MTTDGLESPEMAYTPINCSYYDQLEAWAVKRDWVNVTYLNDAGEFQIVRGVIKDLVTRNHQEFMLLSDGTSLRLDRLIEINGKPLPKAC